MIPKEIEKGWMESFSEIIQEFYIHHRLGALKIYHISAYYFEEFEMDYNISEYPTTSYLSNLVLDKSAAFVQQLLKF
mgnify:CR=1 FL=1